MKKTCEKDPQQTLQCWCQMELNKGKAGINVWAEPHTSSQSPKHRNELERHTEVLQTCRGSSESLLKQRIAAAGVSVRERDITPEHGTNFTTVCASCLSTFTLVHPVMDLSPLWCHKGQWPHPNSLGPGVASVCCLFVSLFYNCGNEAQVLKVRRRFLTFKPKNWKTVSFVCLLLLMSVLICRLFPGVWFPSLSGESRPGRCLPLMLCSVFMRPLNTAIKTI